MGDAGDAPRTLPGSGAARVAGPLAQRVAALLQRVEGDPSVGLEGPADEAVANGFDELADAARAACADLGAWSAIVDAVAHEGERGVWRPTDPAVAALVGAAREARKKAHGLRAHARRPRRDTLRDDRADLFLAGLSAERHAVLATREGARWSAIEALAAVAPPLRVALLAGAASGVLRARLASWDVEIGEKLRADESPAPLAPSLLRRTTSPRSRGLLFALLAEIARACDAAFPDGPQTTSALPERRATGDAGLGPYRNAPDDDPGPNAASDAQAELEIARRAEASGLAAHFETLVAHAACLDDLTRRRVARGPIAKLLAWTRSSPDDLDEAASWHRSMALATLDAATVSFARARKGVFAFDLRQSLLEAEFLLRSMHPMAWVQASGPAPASDVVFQPQAMRALTRLRTVLVRTWGDPGDRADLARAAITHIETRPPSVSPIAGEKIRRPLGREELAVLLGEALRSTLFLEDHRRRDELPGARRRRDELFEAALWRYAPAALLFRLDEVLRRTSAVATTRTRGGALATSDAFDAGKAGALAAFVDWAILARRTFGWLPSDTELLARHWGRTLTRPDGLATIR